MSWPACPECGGKTRVTDSRPASNGVRRRYACENDHRWSTLEAIAEHHAVDMEFIEHGGTKRTVREWANTIGVTSETLLRRLKIHGMSIDEALRAGRNGLRKRLVARWEQ